MTALRAEFGKRTVYQVISGERDEIIELMREKVDDDARKIGVEVLDVRLKRVDLTKEISGRGCTGAWRPSANAWPTNCDSTGFADAEKIRADADREREVIIAEAYRDAQQVKGEGDARAAGILCPVFPA